jgi:predicted aldo/keto reductase-like oxidoreductase
MYNTACILDALEVAKFNYNIVLGGMLTGKPEFASQCQECGECEEKCLQKIPIRDRLKEVASNRGNGLNR